MGTAQAICPWGFLGPFSEQLSAPPRLEPSKPQRPKTFASVLAGSEESHVPISKLSAPTIKGNTVYVRINEEIYQQQIQACRTNLIGRLLLRKGTKPMKIEDLKQLLHSLWQPLGP